VVTGADRHHDQGQDRPREQKGLYRERLEAGVNSENRRPEPIQVSGVIFKKPDSWSAKTPFPAKTTAIANRTAPDTWKNARSGSRTLVARITNATAKDHDPRHQAGGQAIRPAREPPCEPIIA